MTTKHLLILCSLTILGLGSHLLPHPVGFTTVGAISMMAAAYLPRHLMLVPILIVVIVADILTGFYSLVAMCIVYAAHLAALTAVSPVLSRLSGSSVAGSAVINAVVFFLISNLSPLYSGYYPMSVEGITLCYTNAIPFLARRVLANLIFGGIAFGAIWAASRIWSSDGPTRLST